MARRKISEIYNISFKQDWVNPSAFFEIQPFLQIIKKHNFPQLKKEEEKELFRTLDNLKQSLLKHLVSAGMEECSIRGADFRNIRNDVKARGIHFVVSNAAPELIKDISANLNKIEALEQSIATTYVPALVAIVKNFQFSKLPLSNLIGEATVGLYKGLDAYNPEDGRARFFTYGVECMVSQIDKAIKVSSINTATNSTVTKHDKQKFFKATEWSLTRTLGRRPRMDEIATEMGLLDKGRADKGTFMSAEQQALDIQNSLTDEVAIHGEITDSIYEEGVAQIFGISAQYKEFDDFINNADSAQLKADIDNVLRTVSYREREIVKLRYGLGGGAPYTLEEIGDVFQVTQERIRQIEAKLIRKLQQPNRASELVQHI